MTSSNLIACVLADNSATRAAGGVQRDKVLSLLRTSSKVEVDLADVLATPSYLDEFLGDLMQRLGPLVFRSQVEILNVSDTTAPLLRHILARRMKAYRTENLGV